MTVRSVGRHPLRAAGWMLLAQFLFAMMGVGARLGGRGVPWPEVGASRFLVGALIAYAVAKARGQSLFITRQREAWLRSAFGTLGAAGTFYVYASPRLPIGDAITLLSTSPIFVALASGPLLGERVRASTAAALALGFTGIVVVVQPSLASAEDPGLGHVVAAGVGASLASAFAMIWLRRIGPSESSEAIVFHLSCLGSAAMLLASLPVWKTPTPRDALALTLMGLSGGLAQIAMTKAYSLDHAARVSAMTFASVVFMRILALPVFGEAPGPLQAAGSLLVIASGVLLGWARSPLRRGKLGT